MRERSTVVADRPPLERTLPDPTAADAILDRLLRNALKLVLRGESMRKAAGQGQGRGEVTGHAPPPSSLPLGSPRTATGTSKRNTADRGRIPDRERAQESRRNKVVSML